MNRRMKAKLSRELEAQSQPLAARTDARLPASDGMPRYEIGRLCIDTGAFHVAIWEPPLLPTEWTDAGGSALRAARRPSDRKLDGKVAAPRRANRKGDAR